MCIRDSSSYKMQERCILAFPCAANRVIHESIACYATFPQCLSFGFCFLFGIVWCRSECCRSCSFFWEQKKRMVYNYCSMRLYAVILIWNYVVDYANCMTSASISLSSSNDNDGTHSAISSGVVFLFLSIFLRFPCLRHVFRFWYVISLSVLHQTNSS